MWETPEMVEISGKYQERWEIPGKYQEIWEIPGKMVAWERWSLVTGLKTW